jgi:hypothetical protein
VSSSDETARDRLEHSAEAALANGERALAAALYQAAAMIQISMTLTDIAATLDAIADKYCA